QLKYGAALEHLQNNDRSQYSGKNLDSFYDNCAQMGLQGGGEWCYDGSTDSYLFDNATRVNNHRYIFVDTDNPDLRTAYGYGRVRKEQNDLRAIATPLGAGARVDSYNARLAT